MSENWKKLMNTVTAEYSRILGEKLVGVYIHGSVAFGCFNPEKSDIDFITVVESPLTLTEKEGLIRVLVDLTSAAPEKGFEMSVVLRSVCRDFVYPTPYELHFSNLHLSKIRSGLTEYCRDMHGTDPDLAAHFTVIRHVGVAFCGADILSVFGQVPKEAYLDSIQNDVAGAEQQILENPVYIILNLCRVLAYIREGVVLSKKSGGEWGIANLPEEYRLLVETALTDYLSENESQFFDSTKKLADFTQKRADFCKYMLKHIFYSSNPHFD